MLMISEGVAGVQGWSRDENKKLLNNLEIKSQPYGQNIALDKAGN